MFNFLVTAKHGAWKEKGYVYDRGRFLEYTNDEIAERFRELSTPQIEVLKSMPCLFAYEGTDEPMHIGRLKTVKLRDRQLYIEPEINNTIPPIPFEAIKPIQIALDIRDWELSRTHWAIKDEDLMGELLRQKIVQSSAPPTKVDKSSLPAATPPDFKATNVGEFIAKVLSMDHGGKEVFYRGHSNRTKYRLEPNIFRKDKSGNFIHRQAEDRMYRELLVSNSIDFRDDVYTLDRLVRMQHYSLPTRLLDITSNPLIALYFACKSTNPESRDVDGEVIAFAMDRTQIKYFDSDTASCIANLTHLPPEAKDKIDFLSNNIKECNRNPEVRRLWHCSRAEKPCCEGRMNPRDLRSVICVKGKHTNSRISFQSGAFLLFGHDATLDENGSYDITVTRIPVGNKEAVLKQLDRMNINDSTVFPYIESSARYIADKFAFKDNPKP